jgi:nucleoid DNA-binding protein
MSRLSPILRRKTVNHTQRIAHVARQRRSLTKALVREAVERYPEALSKEIASGEWADIPGIGKVQVSREAGKGYVTSIIPGGQRVRHKVSMRLRTKIRLYEKFRKRCRTSDRV